MPFYQLSYQPYIYLLNHFVKHPNNVAIELSISNLMEQPTSILHFIVFLLASFVLLPTVPSFIESTEPENSCPLAGFLVN